MHDKKDDFEPEVIKGSGYYKTEFEKLFQKHFPELVEECVYYGNHLLPDRLLPEDQLTYVFVREEFVEKRILKIFKYKEKNIKTILMIEPDTEEYPRKEIWAENTIRAIQVHTYDNSLFDRIRDFAKAYTKRFSEKVTVTEEYEGMNH